MDIFDDVSKFIESQLDEFLKNNPQLELQAIEEQLQEQERDTRRLISELEREQKGLEKEILAIAENIKMWHNRISKAEAVGQQNLAQAARERESSLLRQGNQRWGQMTGAKERLIKARELLQQTQQKLKEVQVKAAQVRTSSPPSPSTAAWERSTQNKSPRSGVDPLDAQFREWELEEELKQLKRELNN